MSETIERDGKIYEIGKLYTSKDGSQVVLKGLYCDGSFSVNKINHEGRWFTPELTEAKGSIEIGTIKQAPVKLIDGEVYQFDYRSPSMKWFHTDAVGRYCQDVQIFAMNGQHYCASKCTNIVRLVPEEK